MLVDNDIKMFNINGRLTFERKSEDDKKSSRASVVCCTNCPEWMEDGVVVVTGHENGDVRLWGIDWNDTEGGGGERGGGGGGGGGGGDAGEGRGGRVGKFVLMHLIPDKVRERDGERIENRAEILIYPLNSLQTQHK